MAFDNDKKIIELRDKIENGNENAKKELGDYYNTLGLQCFEKGEIENAEKCFTESTKLDDENGKTNLAILLNQLGVKCYVGDEQTTVDYNKAESYFKKSYEFGNENAKVNLGVLYEQYGKQYRDGTNAQINHEYAEKFFKQAIEMGNEDAKYNLIKDYVNCYFNYRYGVNGYLNDVAKANEFLNKARNTDIETVNKISSEYYEKAKELVADGIDSDNYRRINGYLKRASKLGYEGINDDLISFYKYVSNCYKKGKKGFKKDKEKANFYLGKAGELGDEEAIKKYKSNK